jgi:hypothetical protein
MGKRTGRKITSNATKLLGPGEQLQAVFPAQSSMPRRYYTGDGEIESPWWILINGLFSFRGDNKIVYRSVAITNRRILLLDGTKGAGGLIREIPRSTRIGPATGRPFETGAFGEHLCIVPKYFDDIATADAATQ